MTKDKIILLDCDGPLADFTGAYLDAVHALTGQRITHDDVDRWDIHLTDAFARADAVFGGGLRAAVARRVVEPGFCLSIRPHPEARDAVNRLARVAEVWCVTSPWRSSPTWMAERTEWIATHFPEIGDQRVVHATHKCLVDGDMFVDDKAGHVKEWAKRRPGKVGVLFDMHHNQADDVFGSNTTRTNWDGVLDLVECGCLR